MSQQELFYGPDATTPSPDLIDELEAKHGRPIPAEALGAAIDGIAPRPASDPNLYKDAPEAMARKIATAKALVGQDRRMARTGTQGKCPRCKECYRWHSRRPLRMAYCPECGEKLEGTTHLNRWPWNVGVEPLTAIQAWAKFKKS